MKLNSEFSPGGRRGYALLLTMLILAICLFLLASIVKWTSTECVLTARNNLQSRTVAAAEAATERVIAQIQRDFIYQSVSSNLNTYSTLLPNQSGWPLTFEFSDLAGNVNKTLVKSLGPTVVANLNSEFAGLYGLVSPYEVASRARPLDQRYDLAAAVGQTFQLARIPIFQFAIFYTMDLEINPGPVMIVTGKVHGNANIYSAPESSLTFNDAVMSVGNIIHHRHPDDPNASSGISPLYKGKKGEKVSSLTLPIGTNNSPLAVQQILDVPPLGEDPNSDLGKMRFYNLADLIISNSSSGKITIKSGEWNNFADVPPDGGSGTNAYYTYVTNVSFYDYREKKTVTATQVDVAKFNSWVTNTSAKGGSALNGLAQFEMNHGLNSMYVVDKHPVNSASMAGVRVVNGSKLPNDGLTVASQQPLYVKGHFNLNNNDTTVGLTDTSKSEAAALIGDSITVLSGSWQDSYNSGTGLSSRPAQNTTVNAAFLAGIVPSTKAGGTKHYSGGAENFPRFLEDWSKNKNSLTYNGSMVVMYPSRFATNFWINPGTYYGAPTRKWAFDVNFLDSNKLPPMTPSVRKLVRGQWKVLAAN